MQTGSKECNMAKIDLRKLKTYVISLPDSKHRPRISKLLTQLGFEDWEFFDGIRSTPHFSYIVGCSLAHRECVNHATFPCLVFEDDADITDWYKPIIEIPDDSDLFYLGTSAWGLKSGASTLNGSDFEHVKDDIYRVRYMTSAHALIYLNEEKNKEMSYNSIRYMAEIGKCYDESYAMQLKDCKAYCFEKPMFYQNCERNAIFTKHPVTTLFRTY